MSAVVPRFQENPTSDAVKPLISIIIPCFNAANTIRRTLDSVRSQTYRPIEIIAVDDCSRDGTLKLLGEEEAKGVRVIAKAQNAGAAAARNSAMAVATGEFFAFINSDDEWRPDKLKLQIDAISARPEVTMIGCRAEVDTLDGRRVPVNADRAPTVGSEAWRLMLHHSFFVPSVVVARAETARLIGGFDESLRAGEDDQDFFIRMALKGEVAMIDEVLTVMHDQSTSLSKIFASREDQTTLPMIVRHCRLLSDRLGRREIREILGARYSQVGRIVYLSRPSAGACLIIRAILQGAEPITNLNYLIMAAPLSRYIKRRLLPSYAGNGSAARE